MSSANEGEYVLDMIAQATRTHIIGGGDQRSRKDFPVLDYWLLSFTNESGQTHIVRFRQNDWAYGK
jgi:hypothetical protein